MTMPRVGFVTCVELGLSCIEEIYGAGGALAAVITLEDALARRKAGRVYLDDFCRAHAVPLFKIRNINDDQAVQVIQSQRLDWLFIIGWSQIAGARVLQSVRRAVVGMHPTLLPEGRGRAAIPWAILKGLEETGVTLFELDERVDAGPILMQERIPITPAETATTLYTKVADAHRALMRSAWPLLVADRLNGHPQDESAATYWPGRTPADGKLSSDMSVLEMDRLVRATTRPYPGAFMAEADRIIRVWAGLPAAGMLVPPGAIRLACRDGFFDATDFDVEPVMRLRPDGAHNTPMPNRS